MAALNESSRERSSRLALQHADDVLETQIRKCTDDADKLLQQALVSVRRLRLLTAEQKMEKQPDNFTNLSNLKPLSEERLAAQARRLRDIARAISADDDEQASEHM